MKNLLLTFCLCLTLSCTAVFASWAAECFNVRDYGAAGDGTTLDTDAINAAIQAASEAGGGTVCFPAGKYLSYSIRLKDNICLSLESGSVIVAAPITGKAGYDLPEDHPWNHFQDFGHSFWQNSLIWGIGLQNVSIVGCGLIDGSRGLTREGDGAAAFSANKAIALKLCRNVLIRDISILNGGHFALLATGVDNMTLDNVKVDTNRDGFDIDACRHVRIANCHVNSLKDDAIVLKSSYALGFMRACENITITNCTVTGFDPGSFLDGSFSRYMQKAPDQEGPTGRIKIGTESNAGFYNINISNCVFERSRGIALETVDGARIENVVIDNITMRNICNSAIFLRIGGRMRAPEGTQPSSMKRISITNVVATDVDPRYSTLITGLPECRIEDVLLSNISIQYRGGLSLDDARRQPKDMVNPFFTRKDTSILASRKDPYAVPENVKVYPEPCTFGILPAGGMYIRHVKNLTVNQLVLGFDREDTRPVFVLEDVDGVEFRHVKTHKSNTAPTFVLRRVKNFSALKVDDLQEVVRKDVSNKIL